MPTVAGVDSCPYGWIAVLVTFFDEVVAEEHHLLERFENLLELGVPPSITAVDIPLGLLDEPVEGGRECDRAARKVLGQPRASSVFSPPSRSSLPCLKYEEARKYGLNKQSFGILPKVREMDRIMTPELQVRIREAHPEISFFVMAGLAAAASGKKKKEGKEERIGLLESRFYQVHEGLAAFPSTKAAADDILDAYACAWTAMRIFRGEAGRLPDDPQTDSKGMKMEIWY
jgi:predicted RNase H-like nuclease